MSKWNGDEGVQKPLAARTGSNLQRHTVMGETCRKASTCGNTLC